MQVPADPELYLLREELHHHLPRPHRRAQRHVQEAGVTCQERRLGQIILVILLDLDKYTRLIKVEFPGLILAVDKEFHLT